MLCSVFSKTETINVIAEILNNHIEQTLEHILANYSCFCLFSILHTLLVVFLFMGLEIGHKL